MLNEAIKEGSSPFLEIFLVHISIYNLLLGLSCCGTPPPGLKEPIFWSILLAALSSFSGSEQFSSYSTGYLFLSRDSLTKESSSSSMITVSPNVTYIYYWAFDSRPWTDTSKRVTSEQDVLFIILEGRVFVLEVSTPSPGTSSSLKVLDKENRAVS